MTTLECNSHLFGSVAQNTRLLLFFIFEKKAYVPTIPSYSNMNVWYPCPEGLRWITKLLSQALDRSMEWMRWFGNVQLHSSSWNIAQEILVEYICYFRSVHIGYGPHSRNNASVSCTQHSSRQVNRFLRELLITWIGLTCWHERRQKMNIKRKYLQPS